jgi:cell division protein FtsB
MIRFKYADRIPPVLRNKYILTVIIFLIWIIFLDSDNIISRINDIRNINRLKKDREYYSKRIEADRLKLNELKTDSKNLEKFAREQYHMKRPDEDLYIVLTPREYREMRKRTR